MIHILGKENTILNKFIAQVRDRNIQLDSMRFRRNIERIGEIMSYEISKTLSYQSQLVETPLGEVQMEIVSDKVVVATVLRAGLPLQQGVLNYFDDAECAFVSAYRKNKKDGTFKINVEYVSCGDLEGKVLILVDPMLATGQSLRLVYDTLVAHGGEPLHTHVVSVIASEQGVEYAERHLPSKSTTLWLGAVDAELTSKAYIVPGIGDAGDLCYGKKL
ncbi:MAG: uracil phosphoribosyltransferase [Rikenellaceae bacterium]|nr:uracil phosphoribosyltransferase [Rikenellaceae bacterium]MBQ8543957.1 uracil phosphoribosyltransferase [Alistipes sp.]MBR3701996.1 uracil phosphoribosyltransferase [Alistipes sp.]